MIRVNDLKNFIEISAFASLSIAAKKLEVTQPALSESMKRLESDIGKKLFYRTKNGISLTPDGRKFLEKAKLALGNLANLMESDSVAEHPSVMIGCHPVIGSYFLPEFMHQADKNLPGYKIQLTHDLSRNIQQGVQSGVIDIGVVVNPAIHPDLIIKQVAQDKISVWKSKKSKVQDKIIADPNLFQVQSILRKWSKAPKDIISSGNLELIARITERGGGYGIIPERIVKLLKLDLIQVPQTPSFKDELCLVYRPEFGKSEYERELINLITKSLS